MATTFTTSKQTFDLVGETDSKVVAAVFHKSKPYLGLQFHPEVEHSEFGAELLDGFCQLSECPKNWEADCMFESTKKYVEDTVKTAKYLWLSLVVLTLL